MKQIYVNSSSDQVRGQFVILWEEYLSDLTQYKDILDSEANIARGAGLYDAYVRGELAGVSIVVPEAGFVLWGEASRTPFFESSRGRIAQGWGTYVREACRGRGLSGDMRSVAMAYLRGDGFDYVSGVVHDGNIPGGATWKNLGAVEIGSLQLLPLWEK